MQIGNLHVNSFDIFLLVMWALIGLYNKQSFLMLWLDSFYVMLGAALATNFYHYLIVSSVYFYFAQLNINDLSSFRKVFICFGAVYFIGAIDQAMYYHFDVDTHFDRIQPYLITIANAYVVALLIGGRSKKDAGLIDNIAGNCASWLNGLSLRKTSSENNSR